MSGDKVAESLHYVKLIVNFLTNTSNMFIKVKILINCHTKEIHAVSPLLGKKIHSAICCQEPLTWCLVGLQIIPLISNH